MPKQITASQLNDIIEAAGGLPEPGRRSEFLIELGGLVRNFIDNSLNQTTPSPNQIDKELSIIEMRAKKLLSVLPRDGSVTDFFEPTKFAVRRELEYERKFYCLRQCGFLPEDADDGTRSSVSNDASCVTKEVLKEAIECAWSFLPNLRKEIEILADVVCRARASEQYEIDLRKQKKVSRKAGDPALQQLIDDLLEMQLKFFNRLPKTSVGKSNGQPGGPTIRFIEAVLKAIRANLIAMDQKLVQPRDKKLAQTLDKRLNLTRESIRARVRNSRR
jgi:hypothetical protein